MLIADGEHFYSLKKSKAIFQPCYIYNLRLGKATTEEEKYSSRFQTINLII